MKFFRKKRLLLDPERAHVTLPQSDADLVRLMRLVDQWGHNNSYPLPQKYPQYKLVRQYGEILYAIGETERMREAYDAVRSSTDLDTAGILVVMWNGVGSWLA